MGKINTVLFDFDGTLMNTNQVIINSWQHAFKTIEGKEAPLEKIVETFGEPLEVTMRRFFPSVDTKESINIYRDYHFKNFGSMISVFPGGIDTLKRLKEEGYKVGLVTSRLKGTTYEGLEHYDIKKYFDAIITKEDTKKHKPDPEPINITLKKLGSIPNESIMIGDTMYDILCAKNANVESVLVSWAMAVTKSQIEGENGPDHLIENMEDIFKLL